MHSEVIKYCFSALLSNKEAGLKGHFNTTVLMKREQKDQKAGGPCRILASSLEGSGPSLSVIEHDKSFERDPEWRVGEAYS